ncbi:ATP-binding protein [Nocardioides sp. GY 10127]|uniref:sensor histidine kinase n=1 Tax=Nocardioides sp. GY 10127 TaxID=2569762 RepID=UPI0014588BFF|nr:ATP-binding protein [Nocardioides sp. GY 10127]
MAPLPPGSDRGPVHPPAQDGAPRLPLTGVLALLAVQLLLSVASVAFTSTGSSVSAWWPASGVAAGLLLLSPRRRWPALLVAVGLVASVAGYLGDRPTAVVLVSFPVQAIEALVFVLALGAARRRPGLESFEDLARLLLASLAGAFVTAVLGGLVIGAVNGDSSIGTVAGRTLLATHGAALLVVTPLFLRLPASSPTPAVWIWRPLQVLSALVSTLVFLPGQSLPLAFLPVPFVVWGAVLLPMRWLVAEVLAMSVLVTLFTGEGGGPFSASPVHDAGARDALVQLFLVTLTLASLPLALAMAHRREAVEAALSSRETYRRGIAESLIGMMLLRPTTDGLVIIEANGPSARLLGSTRDDLLGRVWTAGLGSHLGTVGEAVHDMLDNRRSSWDHELWLETTPPRCVRLALSPLRDTDEGSLVVAQLVDLTDERTAQRELSDEREFTAALLRGTTEIGILGTDGAGLLTYVNTGAERMLGAAGAELLGRPLDSLHPAEEIRAARAELTPRPDEPGVVLLNAARTARPDRRDWTWVRPDGTTFTVALRTSALTAVDGRPLGFLLVADDVTERRQREASLRAALAHEQAAVERLEEIDRSKNEFVSSVSHELRTPMTSVLGFTQLLSSGHLGPLTDRQKESLGRIDRSGRRLLGLIENILTLSRLESRRDDLELATTDLRDVVRAACEEAEESLRGRSLSLDVHLPPTPVPALVDAEQLERAVLNLLTNAVKFTPDGGTVTVEVLRDADTDRIRVRDTGIGITPEDQARLFERFFRSEGAIEATVPGTGLGLSIVETIMAAHDGSVTVSSAPEQGSTFELVLPR